MIDKIEDVFGDSPPKDIEEWQFRGFKSKEEFEQAKKEQEEADALEEAEYQQKLHNEQNEQLAIQQAIEDGTYYNQEELQEEYNRQVAEDIKQANEEYIEFQKKKEFTFDDLVDKFAPSLIGLKGNSYKSAIKITFYSILANQLKHNYFYADGKKIDLRIPLLIMIKAGHGKKNISKFIKTTIQGIGKTYSEPTSYHAEQFIGKVEKIKDDGEDFVYNTIKGFLHSDYVMLDEAYEVLTSPRDEYQTTLKYIRTALDSIGDNEIEKKPVGIPDEYGLRYFPDCTISLMTQPISEVNEELLTKGSFRRFCIVLVDTSIDERMKARRSMELFINKEEVNKKQWEIWIRNNKIINEKKVQYNTNKDDLILIDDYIDKIINELKLDESKEALEFVNSIQYNIKYLLVKMSIVRAVVEQLKVAILTIKRHHIEKAIEDFDNIWQPQVSWIRKKMIAKSELPQGWKADIHGWILENIQKSDRLQKDVIEKYIEKYRGTFREPTLKSYCQKAIKELKIWGYIEDVQTGNKNEKMLKIKKKVG